MKLLVRRQKQGAGRLKENGIVSINKGTITISEETLNTLGLKYHTYFGIGNKSDGSLVAIFSKDGNSGFNRLRKQNKKSSSLSLQLNGDNKKNMNRYIGHYNLRCKIDILDGCQCFVLRPKIK